MNWVSSGNNFPNLSKTIPLFKVLNNYSIISPSSTLPATPQTRDTSAGLTFGYSTEEPSYHSSLILSDDVESVALNLDLVRIEYPKRYILPIFTNKNWR